MMALNQCECLNYNAFELLALSGIGLSSCHYCPFCNTGRMREVPCWNGMKSNCCHCVSFGCGYDALPRFEDTIDPYQFRPLIFFLGGVMNKFMEILFSVNLSSSLSSLSF